MVLRLLGGGLVGLRPLVEDMLFNIVDAFVKSICEVREFVAKIAVESMTHPSASLRSFQRQCPTLWYRSTDRSTCSFGF